MVYCGLCKDSKDTRQTWVVNENGAEGSVNKFRICDDCASTLLREMTKKVMGIREEHPLPDPLFLSKTGVVSDIILKDDNSLEMTIAMDISKARRIVNADEDE